MVKKEKIIRKSLPLHDWIIKKASFQERINSPYINKNLYKDQESEKPICQEWVLSRGLCIYNLGHLVSPVGIIGKYLLNMPIFCKHMKKSWLFNVVVSVVSFYFVIPDTKNENNEFAI